MLIEFKHALSSKGSSTFGVYSKETKFVALKGEITAAVQAESRTVELAVLPGTGHGTDLLAEYPDLAERIATWLAYRLR